ncbi:hypothetical protein [Chitinophaga sp. CF418]|uniref:hypothetical protein n=1 Tax=Chitinophaga sp. CF418 TaxID=1855287 RepID=UPI0009123BFE|nr:hypothetical protein [Chitinophaga sp. CF418]SHN40571.1 hypothetical protein SAMN05216311_11252 [Chitinophaga sp. CF418]
MKKIKLLFAVLAAVAGTSGAIASNLPSSSSADVLHNWINWDDELVLVNATQTQAQTLCSGTFGICLRAQDNTTIYTVGDFTF